MDNKIRIDVLSSANDGIIKARLAIGEKAPVTVLLGAADYGHLMDSGFFLRSGDYADREGRWNQSAEYAPVAFTDVVVPVASLYKCHQALLLARRELLGQEGDIRQYETAPDCDGRVTLVELTLPSRNTQEIASAIALLETILPVAPPSADGGGVPTNQTNQNQYRHGRYP